MLPASITALIAALSKLPGVGPRSAERIALHLVQTDSAVVKLLAETILHAREHIRFCETCGALTEQSPCATCTDSRRDASLVCVVEEASDISAIERSGEYRGVYHVLGGRLSPLDGVGPDDLTVAALAGRVAAGGVREVIMATNLKLEGEATALYLQEQLAPFGVIVSRIARGIPVGGDLEYADGVTIAQAMAARREMK